MDSKKDPSIHPLMMLSWKWSPPRPALLTECLTHPHWGGTEGHRNNRRMYGCIGLAKKKRTQYSPRFGHSARAKLTGLSQPMTKPPLHPSWTYFQQLNRWGEPKSCEEGPACPAPSTATTRKVLGDCQPLALGGWEVPG